MGKALSATLGTEFSDPDQIIESRLGKTIPQIFSEHGEQFFREIEAEIVADLLGKPPQVIAPGGGWVLKAHDSGTNFPSAMIIYLATSPREVLTRLAGAAGRPVLGDGSIGAIELLLGTRRAVYEASEEAVSTDGRSISEVARAVADLAHRKAGW